MVKSSGFGDKLLEFKSQLHHLLVVCLWQVTSTFHASLDYSFFFFSPLDYSYGDSNSEWADNSTWGYSNSPYFMKFLSRSNKNVLRSSG